MNKQLVMALLASGALVGLSGCSGGGGDTTIIIEPPTNDGGSGGSPHQHPRPSQNLSRMTFLALRARQKRRLMFASSRVHTMQT